MRGTKGSTTEFNKSSCKAALDLIINTLDARSFWGSTVRIRSRPFYIHPPTESNNGES